MSGMENGAGRVLNLLQPRDLQTVVRDAEAAVADGDGSRALGLLRELVAWVGIQPNPAERERVAQMIRDPAMISQLVSLPAQIQRNLQAPGQLVDSPQGQLVVANLVLAMPLANLTFSRLKLGMGEDPLADMLPILDARMVLPRARMNPRVMDVLEGKGSSETGG